MHIPHMTQFSVKQHTRIQALLLRGPLKEDEFHKIFIGLTGKIQAKLCQNEYCTARIHQYCLNNIFSQRKSGRVCSRCGTKWQYEGPKEEAVEEDDEPTMAGQSLAPPAPKRKKPRISDAGECSSQASVASSELRRVTRSSASAR